MIKGQHLIDGQWHPGNSTFTAECLSVQPPQIHNATTDLVDQAVQAAHHAFLTYGQSTNQERAKLLNAVAEQINQNREAICAMGAEESGLPLARLDGECTRTTQQLNMFADYVAQGTYQDLRFDAAMPDRTPIPKPEIRSAMRPLGPVVVFGASNFPLAFSTAGGDTASALAAGCPVIVKGHPAHPGTSDLVAQAIAQAIDACGMDSGVFSLVQDSGFEAAQQLVTHPLIKAVGFTGSLKGGRHLYDLCTSRPEPIPFYGEMGSINPLFVLPGILSSSANEVAHGWVSSLTLGVGQFCTKPGLLVVPNGPDGDQLVETAVSKLNDVATPANMLTRPMAAAYQNSINEITNHNASKILFQANNQDRQVMPHVVTTEVQEWLNNPLLQQEVFGPYAVIVRVDDEADMFEIAEQMEGQLTATLHFAESDHATAKSLIELLEQKAGRIIANGFPTGVEVSDAMVHGGPYPASTYANSTSVGTMAINRFLKPVAYQNIPEELLPNSLHSAS